MNNKVICSQCKYLIQPKTKKEEIYLHDMLHNTITDDPDFDFGFFGNPDKKIILLGCEADKSVVLLGSDINQPKECPLFRNNTSTAWQEVLQDIWRRIKNLNPINIIKFFNK